MVNLTPKHLIRAAAWMAALILAIFLSRLWILSPENGANAQESLRPDIIIPYSGHVVAWSPDETQILTVDYWSTYTSYVFDANIGDLILSIPHERLVGASWNKDATQIMTWGFDGFIRFWDANTEEELSAIDNRLGVERAEWNSSETLILSSGQGSPHIWDVGTANELFPLDGAFAVWSDDTSQILTWGHDFDFVVWDVESGAAQITIDSTASCSICAIWDSENHQILIEDYYDVEVRDSETGTQIAMMTHDTPVQDALWSPNREQVLTFARDNFARLWDAHSGELLLSLEHSERLQGAKWNSDGTQLLTWTWDESVYVWNASTGEKVLQLKYGDRYEYPGSEVTWNQDQTKIYQLATDSSLRIWDAHTGELLSVLHQYDENGQLAPDGPPRMAWNSDETRVVTTRGDTVNIWNIEQ